MIKLYSWNVNGIRAVTQKGGLQKLYELHNPDILAVQEIKAKEDQIDLNFLKSKGDYLEIYNCANKAGYSGVGAVSKIKPLKSLANFPQDIADKYSLGLKDTYGDLNNEGRLLTLEYDKFYLVNVYTPNAKEDLSRLDIKAKHWDPAFLEYIKALEKIKPVIICGDLNVAHTEDDLANPKPNIGKKGFTLEERQGLNNIINAGFLDAFRLFHSGNGFYTWWSYFANARSRNVGWRIDYFIVSKKLKANIVNSNIYPDLLGSDHCPISLELNI